jgi:hypothetical protein
MGIKVLSKAREKVLIYSTFDDAIVTAESDLVKYAETHDVKYLTFEPVDEAANQFGPTEFWAVMPEWSEMETIFWRQLLDLEALAVEAFRLYMEEFKNYRYANDKGEILQLVCGKVFDPKVGRKVVRPEVLEMIPKAVQVGIGSSILTLAGAMSKAMETIVKLNNEYTEEFSVIPTEHEKNSSPLASSNGSTESRSSASDASNIPTSGTV